MKIFLEQYVHKKQGKKLVLSYGRQSFIFVNKKLKLFYTPLSFKKIEKVS